MTPFLTQYVLQAPLDALQKRNARPKLRWPENDHPAARLQDAKEFMQDSADLNLGEMLHHAQVIDPVHRGRGKRNIKDASMQHRAFRVDLLEKLESALTEISKPVIDTYRDTSVST